MSSDRTTTNSKNTVKRSDKPDPGDVMKTANAITAAVTKINESLSPLEEATYDIARMFSNKDIEITQKDALSWLRGDEKSLPSRYLNLLAEAHGCYPKYDRKKFLAFLSTRINEESSVAAADAMEAAF